MDNYIFLGIVTTIIAVIFYKLGIRQGINSPYAFGDTELGVSFKSGNSHRETCNKIKMIILERNHFEKSFQKSTEIIKRLEWATFWMCDSLHNTGNDYLLQNRELTAEEIKEFKQQVSNANKMLSYARNILNSKVVSDDSCYLALIDLVNCEPFSKGSLFKNVSAKSDDNFSEELNSLLEKCIDKGAEYHGLSKPDIIAQHDIKIHGEYDEKNL